MRISIDIPDDQLAELTTMTAEENMSRPALLRSTITALPAARRAKPGDAIRAAFGISPDREDGLIYQERLRSEGETRFPTPPSAGAGVK